MSENFLKIKRKHLTAAIVASAVFAVCFALLCTGALLLACKLTAVKLGFYWIAAACGIVLLSAGAGALLFLLVRPKDKKLAKKLDEGYGLGEKVQTMVEFRESDEAIVVLQRERTNETLGTLRPKKIRASQAIRLAIVPVLSLAMFLAGAIVPSRAGAAPVDPPYDPTEAQIVRMTQLIREVKESRLEEELKGGITVVLENLLSGLNDDETQSAMRESVTASVAMIDGMVAASNSAPALCGKMASTERIKTFAVGVLNAAYYYRSDGIRLTDFESVGRKYDKSETGIPAALEKTTAKLTEGWEEFDGDALKTNLTELIGEIAPYRSAGFAETDGLYAAFAQLERSLGVVAEKVGNGYTVEFLLGETENAFAQFVKDASAPLSMQSYNTMTDEYVRATLADIFGVELPALALPDGVQSGGSSGSNGGNTDESGGGEGDEEFLGGSKDTIYYPPQEKYLPYMQIINEYDKKISEYIKSGAISDELAEIINEYLDILTNIAQQNANK